MQFPIHVLFKITWVKLLDYNTCKLTSNLFWLITLIMNVVYTSNLWISKILTFYNMVLHMYHMLCIQSMQNPNLPALTLTLFPELKTVLWFYWGYRRGLNNIPSHCGCWRQGVVNATDGQHVGYPGYSTPLFRYLEQCQCLSYPMSHKMTRTLHLNEQRC